MVAEGMIQRGVSIRHMAKQFGVREGALRYRLRRLAEGEQPDGRSRQRTATDGYEEAIHGLLERLEDERLTGEGRPAQARRIYEILVREYGFTGSYKSVVRHIRRRYGPAPVRALRRVATPPGVQAQHDWFEARFPWVSTSADQLAWYMGHVELFRRHGGVPLWVRIDNLKTGVARGGGPTAVLNRPYEVFARELGFGIDPRRVRRGGRTRARPSGAYASSATTSVTSSRRSGRSSLSSRRRWTSGRPRCSAGSSARRRAPRSRRRSGPSGFTSSRSGTWRRPSTWR